jgi:hypothetical protein
MSNQPGTSLNLSDGFGASALRGRRAASAPVTVDRPARMARDGYTRTREVDHLIKPPAYAALRPGCTKAR